jgi:hypothetical protein
MVYVLCFYSKVGCTKGLYKPYTLVDGSVLVLQSTLNKLQVGSLSSVSWFLVVIKYATIFFMV